ncbi:uncharacterized protein LOC109793731 isoform X3 [Cajanus cajan]|nr:uncharacterized protein LOC109793731 isoform X3 [Cajanus cajan]XP_020208787.1 uncharacterized protein LOC109793731 isoform X3 [Cajanus cajan]XP_020208788.1 uncharacterized protein LOC109793731 isoform X3 [Cajanus cajan]XP_020208789.1 uncharacterized protein LOC109793731 isoform X3 [Cajanus cajan]XP_029126250.1 uncharacterized protein LOC109793731 isoform X3 [Cajanus cajan]XP_029126251.1 uncharacterized protein LOC109793731 isoform X3 [Cajanus cajan]
MGSVCSASKAEKNRNAEVGGKALGKIKKLKIIAKWKGDSCINSRAVDGGRKQKKLDSGFSGEFKLTGGKEAKLGSHKGSFLGRAGERAVEVLDSLGSSMPKLSTSNGFSSGMAPRGNKISILAFEVANTINKGALLFQSLSEENIQFLKKEILQSDGVQLLVSIDTKELIGLVEADKREEFNVFSREVARFGNICKDPQWHNLDRYFLRLHLDILDNKQPRVEAEKTMQELATLAQNTAELYHELTALERFEQDYQHKLKEMESLNLPLNGDSLVAFHSEIKHQRRLVRSLKKKSLWSRNLEEIVEKLIDIVTHIDQTILEYLGNHDATTVKHGIISERLGEAGLALHYANIVNQINMIACRPTILPPNIRDTLYHGLPNNNVKNALPSRLQNVDAMKELSITQVKDEMDKILQWLTPLATNTTKAHQGFGWVGEWANASNQFGEKTAKENNLIRLQTLYYAEKQKIDFYIIELLAKLHYLVTFVRYRHNSIKPMPSKTSPKPPDFESKMLQIISLDSISKPLGTQLSQEDKRLLEEVTMKRRNPGVSKSENLVMTKKRSAKVCHYSKSVGGSPITTEGLEYQRSSVLDIMDGL